MTERTDAWHTTAVAESAAEKNTPAGAAIDFRRDILLMTQTAEDAVLRPSDPGCWPHTLRAALACRIARLNACPTLAARYLAMIDRPDYENVADPDATDQPADLRPCLAFTDRVATRPRDISAEDIEILKAARVSDADIVRLSELNAFLAYQIRLVAGLSLLAEASP